MRRLLPLLVFAGLCLGSAAGAQLAPGQSGFSGVRQLPQSEAWFGIRQMGVCLVQTRREQARSLLEAAPGSPEAAGALNAMIGRETSCLRNASRIRFRSDFLRGAIAEAFYKRDFRSPPPAVDSAQLRMEPDGSYSLADFADCFAARRPDAVHRLLTTTRLGDNDEVEAMSAMVPEFMTCLPPGTGSEVNFTAQTTRTALAEAMYRRTRPVQSAQQRGN